MIFTNNKISAKTREPEVLLDNRLGKDIQRMLYPVNLILSLFLSSKYTIKDDYITPKGKKFYIATFFFILLLYGLGINRVFFEDIEDTMGTDNRDIVTIIFSFAFVFYSIGFTLIFVLNIIHSDCSISLILTLQKVFNSLDFSDKIVAITRWNWFAICIAFGTNVFLYMLYYVTYHDFNPVDLVMDIMFITFDINLVYGILVITWLRKILEKWIEDVLAFEDGDEEFYSEYFQVYRNILNAYNCYKTLFQLLVRIFSIFCFSKNLMYYFFLPVVYFLQVLFHTADTFFRCLCYFAIILQILQMPDSTVYEQMVQYTVVKVVAAVWQIKDVLLVVMQCLECEKFYMAVEDVETTCIQRLKKKHHLAAEERLCSSVLQANRTSYCKMSACGLFDIDATLPLDLIGLLTNYIVIMLQSFFL
ncbi:hypothetical protein B5X24_HaOG200992 [Helicoverpa armigera]|nr:hypothetical protein B5X24_HaOG200992 [Helicoverpa armigera]